MKVSKIALFLNRQIDSSTWVSIITNEDKTEAQFYISFRSIEAYKSFIKNPTIKEEWMDSFDAIVYKGERLNRFVQYGDFKAIVRKTRLIYDVTEEKKFNEAVLKNNIPITIDISRLSFKKKMEIITHPLVDEKVKFLDKYTEDEEISVNEISEMYQFVLNIANTIKSKNYTQLESIYYIYCELKNKIYNQEKKGENANKSRSLNQIINGNNIVCVGYSNYFLAISDILDLKVQEILWDPIDEHKNGHSSLIAFINDSKYNARGIWGIDTTWDSKKNEYDEEYHNNLSHFLIPLAIDEKEKERYSLSNPHHNIFYTLNEAMNRYRRLIKLNAPNVIVNNDKKNIINRINKIYEYLGLDAIDINSDVELEFNKIMAYKKKYLSILEIDKMVNYVTPKNPDDAIAAMKTTCSYKCMGEDSKSIYRLIRSLK